MSICQDNAGFLFKHKCSAMAAGNCGQCNKPVCEKHLRFVDGQPCCTGCAKAHLPQSESGPTHRRSGGFFSGRHDPYYYGPYYYYGYGNYGHGHWGNDHYRHSRSHDPNDFNEGDAAALAEEGDEGFESDMGAS